MTTDPIQEEPLLSNRLLRILTVIVIALVAVLVAVNLAGRWFGERIVLAGHTTSTEIFSITIGPDRLDLPANVIRFAQARTNGETDRIDLYLAWPQMHGYDEATSQSFNDLAHPGQVIFLQLSQSTMSRDMSGRLDPIYRGLFEGAEMPFESGLTLHHLRQESGYNGEVMLTGSRSGQADYAVRCILPDANHTASNADCQRDIFVGSDLVVLYRFSSSLLSQWQTIDDAVRSYVEAHLATPGTPKQDR